MEFIFTFVILDRGIFSSSKQSKYGYVHNLIVKKKGKLIVFEIFKYIMQINIFNKKNIAIKLKTNYLVW